MTKRRSVARSDDGRGMDATCVSLLSQSPSPAPLPLARPPARSLAWVLPSSLLLFLLSSPLTLQRHLWWCYMLSTRKLYRVVGRIR